MYKITEQSHLSHFYMYNILYFNFKQQISWKDQK